MYYYFSSSYPAIIKINGIYFGEISKSVKFINIDDESSFVEVCPLLEDFSNVNFILNKEFLSSTHSFISITDMKGGYLINFLPNYQKKEFIVYNQQKFPNAVFTCYAENGNKLSIESQSDFLIENVNFYFDNVNVFCHKNYFNLFFVVFIGEKTLVNVYKITDKIERVFSSVCDEFNKEDLSLKTLFCDMSKHVVVKKLVISNDSIKEEIESITKKKQLSYSNLNPLLIPYAFLENFLLGDEHLVFLSDNIKENADKLKDYFSNFIGIMPPPFFRDSNQIGLIYKISNNKFEVKYFTFSLSGQKIENISQIDD